MENTNTERPSFEEFYDVAKARVNAAPGLSEQPVDRGAAEEAYNENEELTAEDYADELIAEFSEE